MLFSMLEAEKNDHRQRESVWEDSSWETALATRRVVRKRSPVMRPRVPSPTPPPVIPVVPHHHSPPAEEVNETIPVHHHAAEKKQTLTEEDLRHVHQALQTNSRRLPLPSGKSHLLSFALLFTACFFLEGALLSASISFTRAATASERVPLTLPVRRDLSDPQMHAFLALLTQMPDVRHVQYITKEQAAALLAERYPEQLPILGADTDALGDTAELTLRSGVQAAALLETFSRPALSAVLEPSFLLHMEEWERALLKERSFWTTAEFSFIGVAVLSLTLLFFALRTVRTLQERMRMEEMRVLTLLGADQKTFRAGVLLPVHLLLATAFLTSLALMAALVFLL